MCVVAIPFIMDVTVRSVDAPAGVTQEEEEGHTGFLRLPSAMVALFFIEQQKITNN